MAQEQVGRILRSACWRDGMSRAVTGELAGRPRQADDGGMGRGPGGGPGGEHLPSAVIRARTRQIARFLDTQGRLPDGVAGLEPPPSVPGTLILAACDRQQAVLERDEADPGRALLRLQLPGRPDPGSYRDWSWVAVPLTLPPTVPAAAALHLPTLRAAGGQVRADVVFTYPVPQARREGHTVAVGLDWGLNTLLSAGAVRLRPDGPVTASARAHNTGQAACWPGAPPAPPRRATPRQARPLPAACRWAGRSSSRGES